jgi:hypothetical protein
LDISHTRYVQEKFFHPVSLTSFLLKTLGRYISDGALVRYPLHLSQHAHHTSKSVETILDSLIHKNERALKDSLVAIGAFLYTRVHMTIIL